MLVEKRIVIFAGMPPAWTRCEHASLSVLDAARVYLSMPFANEHYPIANRIAMVHAQRMSNDGGLPLFDATRHRKRVAPAWEAVSRDQAVVELQHDSSPRSSDDL
jgi:hypothetical protein